MRKKTFSKNLKILKSIIGLEIKTAIEDQYFFRGELDKESLGTLKFTNDLEITFDCHGDAETLHIKNGGFTDKGTLESCNTWKWAAKEFLNSKELLKIGKIHKCYIEWFENKYGKTQTACKIVFESGDFLYIWIIQSDIIFYGMNIKPPYEENEYIKIELIEVN